MVHLFQLIGRFGRLCGGMYRGLLGEAGVMGGGLWCPLTTGAKQAKNRKGSHRTKGMEHVLVEVV